MKNPTIIILAIIAIIVIGYLILKPSLNNKKVVYTYTALEKGNIEEGVLSTGTVEAIKTVEVGTQISGTIKKTMWIIMIRLMQDKC